jgi:hypothetical protein
MLPPSHRLPQVDDLFNIVNQAVKPPLNVDLDPRPQGEPGHSLTCVNIAQNRFYSSQPLAVSTSPSLSPRSPHMVLPTRLHLSPTPVAYAQ